MVGQRSMDVLELLPTVKFASAICQEFCYMAPVRLQLGGICTHIAPGRHCTWAPGHLGTSQNSYVISSPPGLLGSWASGLQPGLQGSQADLQPKAVLVLIPQPLPLKPRNTDRAMPIKKVQG